MCGFVYHCIHLYTFIYIYITKTRRTCERRITELQSVDLLQGPAEAVVKLAASYVGIAVHCTLRGNQTYVLKSNVEE